MPCRLERAFDSTRQGSSSHGDILNFLLDTNVLSEATRTRPDPNVAAWLSTQSSLRFYVSVVSIAEIRKGILLLPEGRKRRKLESWLVSELLPSFAGRVLPLGEEEMSEWSALQAEAERAGRKLPAIDSFIAATARCHGLTLATRNTNDFRHCHISLLNPWTEKKP